MPPPYSRIPTYPCASWSPRLDRLRELLAPFGFIDNPDGPGLLKLANPGFITCQTTQEETCFLTAFRSRDDILGRDLYCVVMCKDGSVHESRITYAYEPFFIDNYYRLNITAYAQDESHAIKIANEKRVQLIAENEWRKG